MAGAPDPRLVNRLGAAALLIDDAVRRRTADVAVDAEALTALVNFGHGRRIEELRAALSLSQPGGAHLVTRLERAGLAVRAPDPSDGRGTLVRLTPRGRAAARRAIAAREDAIRAVVGPLDAAEQEVLLRVLDGLLARASASRRDARRVCRQCDGAACGHPGDCPVTRAADAVDGPFDR
ncbi:MAG TPA: MarR family winged helix-turn-helix transcriptional regulator [Baekduia sp.]|uniref:MarR family winged helix-turn-helix transcriptional regulator n=1 Tax=Baekduia sp. TaxID=2600305 RepID=UPI002D79CAA0|nr:MarR family winged helix-turn-helix transcriptional regulator [Baekduia sp.]HET6505146.1 MarR family winged helix-turn-helix transcriptional regulator [Baekduia sp.]